ncbi:MAG TPA: TetR/AcrR family transcriptional regulator [Rhizorhapis sp.]
MDCNSRASPRERIMEASRELFAAKGFHSAPMAELAAAAQVSVGQIYRHFPCKDDIIVGIAEEDAHENLNILEAIFESTERGDLSPSQAIEMFANNALTRANEALSLEILAESYRNQRVSETIHLLSTRYRDLVRRLTSRARPDLNDLDLEACVEIMTACFYGLGLRTSTRTGLDPTTLSRAAACLIIRGLESAKPREPAS